MSLPQKQGGPLPSRHCGIAGCVFRVSSRHRGIAALRDCVFALSCLRGSAASWHCGIAGLRLCDTAALVLRNMLKIRAITGGLCSVRDRDSRIFSCYSATYAAAPPFRRNPLSLAPSGNLTSLRLGCYVNLVVKCKLLISSSLCDLTCVKVHRLKWINT